MAKLNFPSSPTVGTLYSENGNVWKWNGTSWISFNSLDLTSQVAGALGVTYGGTGLSQYTFGDLLIGAGTTFIKLPIGTDGYFLTADSTSNSGIAWTTVQATVSGSGITTLNNVSTSIQYFDTGTSGAFFNISSSGSTHTFNIPIAGSGSTGLITTSAQTIAGQKTFSSAIIGDLTGTATTSANVNLVNAITNLSHPLVFSPSSSGSGVALSSNTTLSYNPSTNILSTSGLAITSTTQATNATSGALVVTGGVGIGGSLYVSGDLTINGTTTTINSVTLTVDDKNIELGSVTSPSDVTAQGGGITLRGGTDKSINWYSGVGWSSSESWNLASGNTYKINSGIVLSNSSLGTGVTNSSLTAVGTISTGVWSGSLITSYYGGTGYNSYSKGDLLVGAGNTLSKFPVGNNLTILSADSSTGTGLTWKALLTPTYGAFGSTATQQVTAANTETLVSFNLTYESNNVSIGSGSTTRIYINDSGVFNVQFSTQVDLADGSQPSQFDLWFKIDGVNVPISNSRQTIAGKDEETILSLNFVSTFISGQYVELAFSSPDSNMRLVSFSGIATPTRPDIPSVILTVTPVSSILPGSGLAITGLASLNLLTSNAQTLVTGTSGSDFNISSIGSVHTFNIPNASSSARGLITNTTQTIGGIKTFANDVVMNSNNPSTSFDTGTLVVEGGVGIGGSLYVSSATGISGVTINNGVVTGSLSGTASTATYSHQSGYAITSGSSNTSGLATTANNLNVISANTNANHPLLFTPSFGSASGLAVSSNTTLVYNPSSDILSVSGAAITSTTASNTASTGSLVVTGGVGIGQSASIGGRLQLFNDANYTAFVSSASGNTVYTLPATSPATGSSVLQSTAAGVLSWVPMTASSSSGNTSQNVVVNSAGSANVFHPILFTPQQLSSGSAVSSDSLLSYNASTDRLFVSGVAITSGTASTNTSTGALLVAGGVGISGQLSFTTASLGFTGILTNPTMSFIGATTSAPITLTVLTDNSLNFEGSQGSVFSIDSNLSSGEIFSVSDISGLPIISASAGQTVNINEFGGYTQIGNGSINSSSTSTGSLVVVGGLGITGNANIGGSVVLSSSTTSISTTTGALIVSNGVGIGGSLYVGSASRFTSSTASLNTSSGSLVVSGGVGIGGSINVGGASRFSDTTNSTSISTGALVVNGGLGITGNANIGGTVRITNTTNSSSTTSGALSVNGGLGVTGNAFIGGTTTVTNTTNSTSTTTGALVVNGGLGITGNAFIGGTVNVTNTTSATGVSTAALVVSGGLGVQGDVFIAANAGSKLSIMQSSGDEGGEIFLNKPVTNSTITNGVTIDIFQNRLRFFEQGGSARGFYLDITSGGSSVGTNIMGGASSGTVNSGTANYAAFYPASSNAVSENANLQFTGTGISIGGNIAATSTTSGSLRVYGGVGIGGSTYIDGMLRVGTDTFSKNYSQGDISLDNGTTDTPAIRYYWANNKNFGTDVFSAGSGSTKYRIVRDINEAGGVELFSVDTTGAVQLYNGGNYSGFKFTGSGSTIYTLPSSAPATGTSYLTSNSSGVMSWTPPSKTNYVLSFGAGFTPSANSADSVSLNIPFAPDGTTKYYFVKRIDYRNETLSGGTGLSFYLQRHTSGNAAWSTTNTITAGSGASFLVGAAVYSASFTTISSSAGVAGSIVSGDYVRLFFTSVGSAANLSIAMTIEEQ